MADILLKVSLDKMKSKSTELKNQISNIETNWKNLANVVRKSKSYWQGEASDLHRKYLEECEDEMKEILKRLKEHPSDLLIMMGIYDEAEKKAQQLANTLPDDVIV
ncbi:MAG: WXG100 family type VII secretion target [Lachnospiraceae bacterium]|nr:WXG100 family type VII secretion target [Lachnospiraceae bacterium]